MTSPYLNRLSIDAELADRLESDEDFRDSFIKAWAQTEISSSLRTVRKRRKLKQSDVAELAGTGQSAISRIERPGYDGWTFKVLVGVACKLKARLRIYLEPIEDVAGSYANEGSTTVQETRPIDRKATSQRAELLEDSAGGRGYETSESAARDYQPW